MIENPDITLTLFLILAGLGISFICSMVGLGGGVLFIPLLILVFKVPSDLAVGISIFSMTLVTTSATIGYASNGLIDWKLSILYDIFDIPGIIVGAYLTTIIPNVILRYICGFSISILACLIVFKKQKKQACEDPEQNKSIVEQQKAWLKNRDIQECAGWKGKNFKYVVISSFMGGLITGMVGLGGGTVDTTTMIFLGVPMQIAAGSSSLAMLLTNLSGFVSHLLMGNVLWGYALPLGISAFVGAQIGSRLSPKVRGTSLRKILGSVAMFTGLRLLLNF